MRKICILSTILLLFTSLRPVDDAEKAALDYIGLYSHLAMVESQEYGIPASVILAQGLIETNSGQSILARRAKNHFGIKCKSDWQGATYYYIDDDRNAKGELVPSCFRNYTSVEESYRDHSLFLRYRDRYAPLFDIPVSDYEGWCKGLKTCGYATNDRYADALITKIKTYKLYTLDRPNEGRSYRQAKNGG